MVPVKKSRKSCPKRLVMVTWDDAHGFTSRWQDVNSVKVERCRIRTVGWLVNQTQRSVTVAAAVGGLSTQDTDASGCMTIPRGCIVRIKRLGEKCVHNR